MHGGYPCGALVRIYCIAYPFLKSGGRIEPTAGGPANMREHSRFGHHGTRRKANGQVTAINEPWAIQLTMSNSQFH